MVADDIALQIEKAILSGSFGKGSKLPPERKLAEKYGASRTTVRQAIKNLEQLGLVETLPQSGTFVSDYLQDASLDLLIHMMKDPDSWDPATLHALLEARKVIELFALSKAVESATEKDLATLRELASELSAENPQQSAEMDYMLHYHIMKMSSNIAFLLIFNSFKPVYRYLTDLFFSSEESLKTVMVQHRKLIGAFEKKDKEGAEEIMEEILAFGETTVKEYINGNRN
ncbi:FadR/GntR family transcriptional regulator [Spirochaeta isovalerica]|uniref:GntR family transcriptional repressor for pyruvate dehydrogenase complex n=1 Tax=Spirochaeta isovalerica TaxID=150 RepID=A0A841RFQ8_9SPIO|nr:FadR/GntR family transcriptional regulator [Spirochaeta isovalerica]MBB6482426.1 GntR family transcriptional repressor for pyruvate dehydrogenase complex [Spirochaeta isovalerica]